MRPLWSWTAIHLERRIEDPHQLAAGGQVLMDFLNSVLGKIAWGYDFYRQGGAPSTGERLTSMR